MKKFITLTSLLAFGAFANAQEEPAAEKCATSKCSTSACSADECTDPMVKWAGAGLEDESAAKTTEISLGAMAGITHCSTCSKSGTVTVNYNPEKMTPAEIEKLVAQNGLTVSGQKTSFEITGLACQSCSNHLTTVLGETEGVVKVDKVCHMSGHAAVTFDASKTDIAKIKDAINTTSYKVAEAKAAETTVAPAS